MGEAEPQFILTPLVRPIEDEPPSPGMDTGGRDWAIPCRGREGGRLDGFPPAIPEMPIISDICDILVHRVSAPW